MLILRMLSGLLAGVWGLVRPVGRWKNRVAKPGFGPEPSFRTATASAWSPGFGDNEDAGAGKTGDPYLATAWWFAARAQMSGSEEEPLRHYVAPESGVTEAELAAYAGRLERAAAWHAMAARKAVEHLDGEGVLDHMRHFRRYSSGANPRGYTPGTCGACGATARGGDMSAGDTPNGRRLVCAPCSGRRDRPAWIAKDGRAAPVAEMGDGYLVNSAAMVRRWLREGACVSDDRIRMCGHILEECAKRGLMREVGS